MELAVIVLIESRLQNVNVSETDQFPAEIIDQMIFILRMQIPDKKIPYTSRPLEVRGRVIGEVMSDISRFSQKECIDKWTRMDSKLRKHMPRAFYDILGLLT